jgi:hypothetical protein
MFNFGTGGMKFELDTVTAAAAAVDVVDIFRMKQSSLLELFHWTRKKLPVASTTPAVVAFAIGCECFFGVNVSKLCVEVHRIMEGCWRFPRKANSV